MTIYSTEEYLRMAVHTLLTSPQILEVRLADAYQEYITRIVPKTLPVDLAKLYYSIRERLIRENGDVEDSSLLKGIRKLTAAEAIQLAEDIYELQRRFSTWYSQLSAWEFTGESYRPIKMQQEKTGARIPSTDAGNGNSKFR